MGGAEGWLCVKGSWGRSDTEARNTHDLVHRSLVEMIQQVPKSPEDGHSTMLVNECDNIAFVV